MLFDPVIIVNTLLCVAAVAMFVFAWFQGGFALSAFAGAVAFLVIGSAFQVTSNYFGDADKQLVEAEHNLTIKSYDMTVDNDVAIFATRNADNSEVRCDLTWNDRSARSYDLYCTDSES